MRIGTVLAIYLLSNLALAACPQVSDSNFLAADLNSDCIIDINDIEILAEQWLASSCTSTNLWCTSADATHSGSVNLADFAHIANYYDTAAVYINSTASRSFEITTGQYKYSYNADSPLTITNPATNFLTRPITANRNDFSGRVGYSFIPSTNFQIDALGRGTEQSATQNHIVELWDTVAYSRVAYVTVTASTPTDSIGCQMIPITPITLLQGREYIIVTQEFNGGDLWLSDAFLTGKYHSEFAAITGNTYATTSPGIMPPNYHNGGYDMVMGPGTFHVTSSTTNGNFMLVNKQGVTPTCLATGFAAGLSYNFLNSSYVSNISIDDAAQCITISIPGSCSWANYTITLYFYKQNPGMMRYKCEVTTTQPLKNPPNAGAEWKFFDKSTNQFITSAISDYTGPYAGRYQWGRRYDASCYFIDNTAIQSLVFLKADLTSMNDYAIQSSSVPNNVTTAGTPGFGVSVKASSNTIPAGQNYTLYDAYLCLDPAIPTNNPDAMIAFINHMGDCYKYMQQPSTSEYTDWPALVPQMLADVNNNPENWSNPWNGTYVMPLSYVGTAKTDWEIGAMSSLLIPLMSYESQRGPISNQQPLMNRLKALAPAFYQSNWANTGQGLIWNNPPSSLAISATVDPWYYTWATEVMGSLAVAGLNDARTAVFGAYPRYKDIATAINYEYRYYTSPYYKTTSGEPEYDCTGSYLYHMLQLYSMTATSQKYQYLTQAKLAAPHIAERGLDLAYEISTTAEGFAGLMWLYQITNDPNYLRDAYIPLANVVFHSWMFENDLGYAANFRTFWRTSATPGNKASASFEDSDVYRFIYEGYMKAPNALSPQARCLIAEFFKWNQMAAKYSLPQFIPADMIDTTPKCGVNNLNYCIPLEDLWGDGFNKAGQTGQEIYGMNILWYAVLPYKVFSNNNIEVFSDYPIISCDWNQEPNTIRIHIGGTPNFNAAIRVKYTNAMNWLPENVQVFSTDSQFNNRFATSASSTPNLVTVNAQGNGYYVVKGQ